VNSRPSSIALILANLIPLAGVLLFEWNVLEILLLYWTESVVIGLINVLRMASCQTDNILAGLGQFTVDKKIPPELQANVPPGAMRAIKFFIIPFFVLHYGGFCYGHLMAVTGFFSTAGFQGGARASLAQVWQWDFWIAVAAIGASHLFSFFNNYIGKNEYKQTSLFLLMQRPYGRIVAMHIAIVFGAGFVMWLGSPLPILMILIVVKTTMDLKLHQKERVKMAATN
jgi:hypothetical protein